MESNADCRHFLRAIQPNKWCAVFINLCYSSSFVGLGHTGQLLLPTCTSEPMILLLASPWDTFARSKAPARWNTSQDQGFRDDLTQSSTCHNVALVGHGGSTEEQLATESGWTGGRLQWGVDDIWFCQCNWVRRVATEFTSRNYYQCQNWGLHQAIIPKPGDEGWMCSVR